MVRHHKLYQSEQKTQGTPWARGSWKTQWLFRKITGKEPKTVIVDAEERYLAYVLLKQSWRKHVKLKSDIQNDYTTGDGIYVKTQQNTLNILTHYTKPNISRNSKSEGHSFDHISSDIRDNQTNDKAYCKDKECYTCHIEGYPSSHCPNHKRKKDYCNNK